MAIIKGDKGDVELEALWKLKSSLLSLLNSTGEYPSPVDLELSGGKVSYLIDFKWL